MGAEGNSLYCVVSRRLSYSGRRWVLEYNTPGRWYYLSEYTHNSQALFITCANYYIHTRVCVCVACVHSFVTHRFSLFLILSSGPRDSTNLILCKVVLGPLMLSSCYSSQQEQLPSHVCKWDPKPNRPADSPAVVILSLESQGHFRNSFNQRKETFPYF